MRTLVVCGLSMALVGGAGCATRGWVQEELAERDVEITQRVASIEGTAAEARARREREQAERERRDQERADALAARMSAIEQALAEVRDTSRGARQRADEAVARAEAADSRLTRLWRNRHARNVVNSLNIQFRFDASALDDPSKSALHALVLEMRRHAELSVDLEGYADSTGSRDYNMRLSRRRVEAVQRYLEEQGVEPRRINAIARGPLTDPTLSDHHKRRVVVKIMLDAE